MSPLLREYLERRAERERAALAAAEQLDLFEGVA